MPTDVFIPGVTPTTTEQKQSDEGRIKDQEELDEIIISPGSCYDIFQDEEHGGGGVSSSSFGNKKENDDDDDNGKRKKKSVNWATIPMTITSWFKSMIESSCNHISSLFKKNIGITIAFIIFVILVSVGITVGSYASSIEVHGLDILTHMEVSLTANMIKHPSYTGDLFPMGTITLRFDEPTQTPSRFLVSFQMEGLEPFCEGCTWRIIHGTSCIDAASLSGEDIWNPNLLDHNPYGNQDHNALYDTTEEGISTSKLKFYMGYGAMAIENNAAFIIFAKDQSPLACGILRKHGQPSNHQLRYFTHLTRVQDNEIVLPGYTEVEFYLDGTFALKLYVGGLPLDCVNCIVDIQDGVSCSPGELGNVFVNPDVYQHNVWTPHNGAVYTPNHSGVIDQTIYLDDGFGFDDHKGKLIILRQSNAAVYACGVLETKKRGHSFEKPQDKITTEVTQGIFS